MKAKDIITKIFEEEMDFLTTGKRDLVTNRIVEALQLENVEIINTSELKPSTGYIPPIDRTETSTNEKTCLFVTGTGREKYCEKVSRLNDSIKSQEGIILTIPANVSINKSDYMNLLNSLSGDVQITRLYI